MNKYLLIIVPILIIFNNLVWFIIYKRKKVNIIKPPTYKEAIEDIMNIIHYKCFIAKRRVLEPLVDKALKGTPLINDNVVNKVTLTITKELIDECSPEYLDKLKTIYKKEKIEDILLELVYNVVTEMSLDINKNSIKKSAKLSMFRTLNSSYRRDIDSTEEIE